MMKKDSVTCYLTTILEYGDRNLECGLFV